MKRLVLVSILTGVVPVNAGFLDGNKLHEFCRQEDPWGGGWVAGFHDGYHRAARERGYCAPADVTIRQMFDVLCGYLKENAGTRHRPASELATEAFTEAFPCSKLR